MRRIFPVLVLLFSLASLLIFLLGDSGLAAYDDLAAYRDRLAANVASLAARNGDLQARLARLRDDPDTERVMARDLGLFQPGERVIHLEGSPGKPEIHAVGDLLRYRGAPSARNGIIKAAGVCLALLALGWSLARALAGRRRDARSGR